MKNFNIVRSFSLRFFPTRTKRLSDDGRQKNESKSLYKNILPKKQQQY